MVPSSRETTNTTGETKFNVTDIQLFTFSPGTVFIPTKNHRSPFFCFRMAAATQEERDQWMSAIEDSIEDNPFCRIIEEKKASRRHMELNGS